jgi:hypothetical protein
MQITIFLAVFCLRWIVGSGITETFTVSGSSFSGISSFLLCPNGILTAASITSINIKADFGSSDEYIVFSTNGNNIGTCSGTFQCPSSYQTCSLTFSNVPIINNLVIISFDASPSVGACPTWVQISFSYSCNNPTSQPTSQPTLLPTTPTSQPSSVPTNPTSQPSSTPTTPTSQPSKQPSRQPTAQPTSQPSCQPFKQPTAQPTVQPFSNPTSAPSYLPSSQPSIPTSQPSGKLYDKLDEYGYDTLNLCEVIPFVHHSKEEIIVFMEVLKDELRNRDIDIV